MATSMTAGLTAVFKANTRPFNRVVGRLGKITRSAMKQVRRAVVIGTAALVGLGVAAYRAGAAYEKAWAEVTTISNDSAETMARMRKEVIALSIATGQKATGQARAYYQTLSAGITDANDAMTVMKAASKLGVAGMSDTETAVDAITTVLNSYGRAAGDSTQISDVMFETVRLGKIRLNEFAGQIGKVAPIAATAGISFEEVAAATARLTLSGLEARKATTGLRATMLAFIRPTQDAKDAAASIGFNLSAATLRTRGLAGAMGDLIKKVGQSGTAFDKQLVGKLAEVQNATMAYYKAQKRGGPVAAAAKNRLNLLRMQYDQMVENGNDNISMLAKLVPNVRALGAVAALTSGGVGKLDDILKQIRGSAGSTEKAFGKIAATTSFKFAQIRRAGEARLIGLFDWAKERITANWKAITAATDWAWSAMQAIWQNVGKPVFMQVIAIGQQVIAWVQAAWPTILQTATYVWNSVRDVAILAWTNISKVVGGMVLAIKDTIVNNWESIKAVTKGVFDAIMAIFKVVFSEFGVRTMAAIGIVLAAVKVFMVLKAAFIAVKVAVLAFNAAIALNPIGAIAIAITAAVALIIMHWDKIGPYFTALWEGIKAVFEAVWSAITWIVRKYWEGVKLYFKIWAKAFEYLWIGIKATVLAIWYAMKWVFVQIWEGIKAYFMFWVEVYTAIWEGIKTAFVATWNFMKDTVVGAWQAMVKGAMFIWNFFVKVWNGIKDTAIGVWDWIVKAFWKSVGFFKKIGKGIWDFISWPFRKLIKIVRRVWGFLKRVFGVRGPKPTMGQEGPSTSWRSERAPQMSAPAPAATGPGRRSNVVAEPGAGGGVTINANFNIDKLDPNTDVRTLTDQIRSRMETKARVVGAT